MREGEVREREREGEKVIFGAVWRESDEDREQNAKL